MTATKDPIWAARRDAIHAHNRLRGYAVSGVQHMREIMSSKTATPEAKALANDIYIKLTVLGELVKVRLD